jgi:hypothetical protein
MSLKALHRVYASGFRGLGSPDLGFRVSRFGVLDFGSRVRTHPVSIALNIWVMRNHQARRSLFSVDLHQQVHYVDCVSRNEKKSRSRGHDRAAVIPFPKGTPLDVLSRDHIE